MKFLRDVKRIKQQKIKLKNEYVFVEKFQTARIHIN